MWYRVKALREKGLNKSQISKELGIDRGTVRKYIKMDESRFQAWMAQVRHMPKKLHQYQEYVKVLLEEHPYLSAAQVEDRLKEEYEKLPKVNSKTVYNFVMSIRKEYGIKKPKKEQVRDFEQIPEMAYGFQAQVDFGEHWMRRKIGGRQKVYFLAVVLCRSRYKYTYYQDHPFIGEEAVHAHQQGFVYLQGVPSELLYDQDKVFVVDENLGDVVLTARFKSYVEQEGFRAVFCRKSDPQTKGKVENVVKYVKNNFLKGRYYESIEDLNERGLGWLSRTANAKKHGTTRKIPKQEWEIEKNHLRPIKLVQTHEQGNGSEKSYKVRKDNTIAYRGNFYTVPTGTYVDRETRVWLKEQDGQLHIRDGDGKETIAVHPVCLLKGKTIRNNNHLRDKSTSLKAKEKEVLNKLDNDLACSGYLKQLHQDKPRYYHDHLQLLLKLFDQVSTEDIKSGIELCSQLGIYNANQVKQIAIYEQEKRKQAQADPEQPLEGSSTSYDLVDSSLPGQAELQPLTSDINTYESIMQP
jgi:transposase